jgi:FtsP/CotA-like multicopper oxidase with cupredoxin domain
MEENMATQKISRRRFLKGAGFGAAALFGTTFYPFSRGPSLFDRLTARTLAMPAEEFMPDAVVSLTAAEKTVQILPGTPTLVWSYEGFLESGTGVTLQNLPGNYLGPVLRVKSGTKVRINFHNNLTEESVVHPHGLHVPEDCDGQPMQAIGPGETKIYDFQVIDPADRTGSTHTQWDGLQNRCY